MVEREEQKALHVATSPINEEVEELVTIIQTESQTPEFETDQLKVTYNRSIANS